MIDSLFVSFPKSDFCWFNGDEIATNALGCIFHTGSVSYIDRARRRSQCIGVELMGWIP